MAASTRSQGTRNQQKDSSQNAAKGVTRQRKDEEKQKLDKLKQKLNIAEKEFENSNEEKKQKLAEQMQQVKKQVEDQQADLDAMEIDDTGEGTQKSNETGGNAQNKTGNTTHQENPTPVNIKSEPHDPSIFVNEHQNTSEDSGDRGDDSNQGRVDDEIIGLVSHVDALSVADGKMVKFYSVGKRYYAIDEYGQGNRRKYAIRTLPEKPAGEEYKSMNLDDAKQLGGKGRIYQILGVAWKPKGHLSRMMSMSYENWTQENNGIRRRAPELRVQVRWDNSNGEVSWEKRGRIKAVWSPDSKYRGIMGNERFEVPERVEYDNIRMLQQGDQIFKADFAIIDSAVRYEKRHDELAKARKENKEFQTFERDATPAPPFVQ